MKLIYLSLLASAWALVNPDQQVITRDVCVIGGGSAGTYAAVRLQEMNQSVVVVEKSGRLGGNTDTYIDPETNITVEYGVIFFDNITVVHDYFGSLGVPLKPVSINDDGFESQGVDLSSGTVVGNPQGNVTEAMSRYILRLLRYPYLSSGFDLPLVVPQDLLLPFGEFADKYKLGPAVEPIASVVQGVGNILNQPTLYVMKTFSPEVLQGAQSGFLGTQSGSNIDLYKAAQNRLEGNILFNSTVAEMDRNRDSNWVHVAVHSPGGHQLIKARRILFAIPPKLDNLNGVDLDHTEQSLFGKFSNTFYYTMLARIDGLSSNTYIVNRGNNTWYNLPLVPCVYSIRSTRVPGLYNIWYGSEHLLSENEVKTVVVATIQRLQAVDIHASTPEFVAFSSHQPFQLTVPSTDISNGFYRHLKALQGRSRTFYTGATFETHDSARIWRFTEDLLKTMVRGM